MTTLQQEFGIFGPRRFNRVRSVILFTAAATAGLTILSEGQFAPGLALAFGGSLYVLATAILGIIEHEQSPHHTAITAGDLLLVTTIVWHTGGVSSEYYLLYYLPVLCAGLRLNTRDGIASSVLAGVLYCFVALAGEPRSLVLTAAPYRMLAVCTSAVVAVVFFTVLRREVHLVNGLRKALHSSLNRVAAIYDVAHAANTGAELTAVLSILLEQAACITRAANGAILLLGQDGQLKHAASLATPSGDAALAVEFPRAPAAQVLASGSPVILGPEQHGPAKDRSFAYVPVSTTSAQLGVLALASAAGRRFTRVHLEFLSSLCSEAALAIENARLRSELRRLAVTDHLTGLPSRREIERRLLVELTRSRRYQRPLAVLMVDVDNLKSVNDAYGHAAGDELLRLLGSMLQTELRVTDAAGRIGGDEFIVVLAETSAGQAEPLADRLIRAFPERLTGALAKESASDLASLTGISIGVAGTRDGAVSAKQLIARADGALYEAKRLGKRRSHIADEAADLTSADLHEEPIAL